MASDSANIYVHDLQIVGEVSVKPSWQLEKSFATVKLQTDPEYKEQSETQTVVSALTAIEACDKNEGTAPRSSLVPLARMDGTQYVYVGKHYDEASLLSFLNSAKDDVLAIMQQNARSKAFDHYEPNWSGKSESVECGQVLTAPHTLEAEWHVTQMAWNCTGTTLAVAYGRVDTTGWCKQRGYVCCWNFARRDFDVDRAHQTIEVDSYATSVAFHPVLPAMLAVGTYNGEVSLWSVASGDDAVRVMASAGSATGSKEAVLQLHWLQNAQEQRDAYRYVLCSASQDGKILFWASNNKFAEPLASYEIQNKRRCVVGVQAMSFMKSSAGLGAKERSAPAGLDNLMLLGVEDGEVFRTKPGVTAAVRQGSSAGSSVLEVDHYEAHRGPVNALDCSPFFRNLFLTASSDGSLRLYSTLERQSLLTLEPSVESRHYLYAAQFSPFRAAVLGCVSRSGSLHIYDLEKTRTKPVFTADAGVDGAPVYSLAFNPQSARTLATGDGKGRVTMWNLSSELTQLTDVERAAIRSVEQRSRAAAGGGSSSSTSATTVAEKSIGMDEGEAGSEAVRLLFGFAL